MSLENIEPYFNFCPKCASKNIEFIDHREFRCFDCQMVFYQNLAAAVAVIIEKNEHILFVVRNQNPKKGYLDLPGGFVDPDETAEQACARELNEELGINLNPEDFTYFSSQPNLYIFKGIPYRTEDLVFTAKLEDGQDFSIEKNEIQSVRWIEKSEIKTERIGFDSLRKITDLYLNHN